MEKEKPGRSRSFRIATGALCDAGQHVACVAADTIDDRESPRESFDTNLRIWICACECHSRDGEFESPR